MARNKGYYVGGGQIRARLDQLRASVAVDVAQKISPKLTVDSRQAYDAGKTVYGTARPLGENGSDLDLVQTGAARDHVRFLTVGTRAEVPRGPRYFKYLIAKYWILPPGNKFLPENWRTLLSRQVEESCDSATPGAKHGGAK